MTTIEQTQENFQHNNLKTEAKDLSHQREQALERTQITFNRKRLLLIKHNSQQQSVIRRYLRYPSLRNSSSSDSSRMVNDSFKGMDCEDYEGSTSTVGMGNGDTEEGGENNQMSEHKELKDRVYREKRRKNNESAKRSRDARRLKEEQIALRVVYLEQENLQLSTEVALLQNEIEKLRCMLCRPGMSA